MKKLLLGLAFLPALMFAQDDSTPEPYTVAGKFLLDKTYNIEDNGYSSSTFSVDFLGLASITGESDYTYTGGKVESINTSIDSDGDVVNITSSYTTDGDNVTYTFNDGAENGIREVITYTDGKITMAVVDTTDGNGGFTPSNKFTVTYNGDNVDEILHYEWEGTAFEVEERDVFVYTDNKLSQIDNYDDDDGVWVRESYSRFYYTDNKIDSLEAYSQDDFLGWIVGAVTNYTYDGDNISQMVSFVDFFGTRLELMTLTLDYDGTSSLFGGAKKAPMLVYPNPAVNQITIQEEFVSGKVITLLGNTVQEFSSQNVDLSNLENGTYIVEITKSNGAVNQRSIIKN